LSIAHLQSSQQQLQEYMRDNNDNDKDFVDAYQENKLVMSVFFILYSAPLILLSAAQSERIAMLCRVLDSRGVSSHYQPTQSEETGLFL
jgi:hypothetical protein